MTIKLIYRKDNGDESERTVIPIGFDFGDRDKVLCLDLSKYSGTELALRKELAEELRDEFIKGIKTCDLGSDFRSFILDNIVEIT